MFISLYTYAYILLCIHNMNIFKNIYIYVYIDVYRCI